MQLAALALAALASAGASVAAPPDTPLAAFVDYGHPDVGADACQSRDPGHTECVIPAKTAGRYVIDVAAAATASGPNAAVTLHVGGTGWSCGQPVSTKKGDWTTGKRTIVVQCVVTVLNDAPLSVVATSSATDAKQDAGGPVVTLHRIPWNGILEVNSYQAGMKAPPSAAKPPKEKQ